MILVGLTKKLQDKSKIKIESLPEKFPSDLNSWHAHLFTQSRKSGVIIMNDLTRYSVILYGLKKADFQNLSELFLNQLIENMKADDFNETEIIKFTSDIDKLYFTKTSSRSILGSINDCLHLIEWWVDDFALLSGAVLTNLNKRINRSPMLPLEKEGFDAFPRFALHEAIERI